MLRVLDASLKISLDDILLLSPIDMIVFVFKTQLTYYILNHFSMSMNRVESALIKSIHVTVGKFASLLANAAKHFKPSWCELFSYLNKFVIN